MPHAACRGLFGGADAVGVCHVTGEFCRHELTFDKGGWDDRGRLGRYVNRHSITVQTTAPTGRAALKSGDDAVVERARSLRGLIVARAEAGVPGR
jgi:hypothetical protein